MYKENVVNYFGSQSELARKLRLTRQAVGLWSEVIPEKHAFMLDMITRDEEYPLIYVPELYGDSDGIS